MLATLVGLSMLLALIGGTATLVGGLLARRLRARQAQRQPEQAAARERTRQHRFPTAEFVTDDQGVTATVAAIAGASLADYQRAAGYLADTRG